MSKNNVIEELFGRSIDRKLWVAPMAGVTDRPFRTLCKYFGAGHAVSEMMTSDKTLRMSKKSLYRANFDGELAPISAQIAGSDPHDLAEAARYQVANGAQIVDINMGCPAATVVKNGGGSDLIRHFDKAEEIIAAAKKAGLAVSVKTRLGFNQIDTFEEWIPFILKQDVPLLTVHMRTRKEMSKVPAHFEYIDRLIQLRDEIAPNTLLQINGDIKDRTEGLELVRQHPGVNGIMIGRGIFENPFAFEITPKEHTLDETLTLLRMQLDLYDQFTAEFGPMHFQKLKRFFKIYVRHFSYASDLRVALMDTTNTTQVRELLDQFDEQWAAQKASDTIAITTK